MGKPTKDTHKKIDPNDVWLGVTAAGKRAGVTDDTWARWVREGVGPAPDGYAPNGTPRWRSSTVDRCFEEGAAAFAQRRKEKRAERLKALRSGEPL